MTARVDRGARGDTRQRRALQGAAFVSLRRRVFEITALDLIAGGTTLTKPLFELAPREIMLGTVIVPRATWTGVTTMTIGLGITGSLTKYAADYNVVVTPADNVFQYTPLTYMESVEEPVEVQMTVIGDGGSTAVANAEGGLVRIEALIVPA